VALRHATAENKRLEITITRTAGPEVAGAGRFNLTSDAWHRGHPEAAKHLFGFKSWHETLVYLWVFWPHLVRPQLNGPAEARTRDMTPLECCLITKMRFRRGFCLLTLALMWGRTATCIGKYYDTWAPAWGEAGEDFSILDLCDEDLDLTCPASYKAMNLSAVGAVPDGKDFMIDVPRSSSLIEKGAWSDKVHHVGVRTISWSAPAGLSSEHTDLFLARVPEKKLVEIWGARLIKVPAGRPMLSDRGFAGTSRYYLNLNVQITPRFLKWAQGIFHCGGLRGSPHLPAALHMRGVLLASDGRDGSQ
jgi:hypothetical protein